MKDFKYIWLLLLLILNSFGACSDDDPLMPGERPSSELILPRKNKFSTTDLILIRLFLKRMNH